VIFVLGDRGSREGVWAGPGTGVEGREIAAIWIVGRSGIVSGGYKWVGCNMVGWAFLSRVLSLGGEAKRVFFPLFGLSNGKDSRVTNKLNGHAFGESK